MKAEDFREMISVEFEHIIDLNRTKGGEYAGEDDALAFLKEAAAEAGITPDQIWYVLARKHWMSIAAYVREGKEGSEKIEGRIRDEILYLLLLLGLVREREAPDDSESAFIGGDQVLYRDKEGVDWRAVVMGATRPGDEWLYSLDFQADPPPFLSPSSMTTESSLRIDIERQPDGSRRDEPTLVLPSPTWAKLDHEPKETYDMFITYRDLGPEKRSLQEVADKWDVEFKDVVTWAREFEWDNRLGAWDRMSAASRRGT